MKYLTTEININSKIGTYYAQMYDIYILIILENIVILYFRIINFTCIKPIHDINY